MNTNDLYLEYARVIQMCKGTDLEDTPWACVRWRWKMSVKWFDFSGHPNFSETNTSIFRKDVDFAVAVLEGKPVFVGDRIYAKRPNSGMCNGAEVIIDATGKVDLLFDTGTAFSMQSFDNSGIEKYFTWTPPAPPTPKRTFTLNGVELPCPKPKFKEGTDWTFDISGYLFGFDTKEECDSVYQAIIKLLTEARDK